MKTFKEFLNESTIKFKINKDLSIDAFQDVNIATKNLKEIPLNFNIIEGNFACSDNKLITLKGCPKEVKGNFYCHINQLTSLDGCPKIVRGSFWCSNNQLTSLKGCPKEVLRNFNCSDNKVKFTKEDVSKVCNVGKMIDV